MVTRPQIEKISTRIEALVAASEGGVVYIWRDRGQTVIQACELIISADLMTARRVKPTSSDG
jgi:hypothetical protein